MVQRGCVNLTAECSVRPAVLDGERIDLASKSKTTEGEGVLNIAEMGSNCFIANGACRMAGVGDITRRSQFRYPNRNDVRAVARTDSSAISLSRAEFWLG